MLDSWFGSSRAEGAPTIERSAEEQARVDEQTRRLALYHYDTCWFCGRVRATIQRLGLTIELRNIHQDPQHFKDLTTRGGSSTVPCLAIDNDAGEIEWMYESADICRYLEERFGADSP